MSNKLPQKEPLRQEARLFSNLFSGLTYLRKVNIQITGPVSKKMADFKPLFYTYSYFMNIMYINAL